MIWIFFLATGLSFHFLIPPSVVVRLSFLQMLVMAPLGWVLLQCSQLNHSFPSPFFMDSDLPPEGCCSHASMPAIRVLMPFPALTSLKACSASSNLTVPVINFFTFTLPEETKPTASL
jgi:hypothetical protein